MIRVLSLKTNRSPTIVRSIGILINESGAACSGHAPGRPSRPLATFGRSLEILFIRSVCAMQSVSSTVTLWRGPSQAYILMECTKVRKLDGGWDFKAGGVDFKKNIYNFISVILDLSLKKVRSDFFLCQM